MRRIGEPVLLFAALITLVGCNLELGRLSENPRAQEPSPFLVQIELRSLSGAAQRVPAVPFKKGYLVQGDMYFLRSEGAGPLGLGQRTWVGWGSLWPGGVVVYEFDPGLSRSHRELFLSAVRHIEERTNLKFKSRTDEEGYIRVIADDDYRTCWSAVGYRSQEQELDLACGRSGLPSRGVAVHEILHALGFHHEQSRPDRDEYVKIRWENIEESAKPNFYKLGFKAQELGPYDYYSIMHYSAYSFSKNGQPTIVPKKVPLDVLGSGDGLSELDVQAIKTLYTQPWLRMRFWDHYSYVGGSSYSIKFLLENTGAIGLKIVGVRATGWLAEATLHDSTLAAGEEADISFTAEPCAKAGFEKAKVVFEVEGAGRTFHYGVWRTCFPPEADALVRIRPLSEATWQLTYAATYNSVVGEFPRTFIVEATINGLSVTPSPSVLESEHGWGLYAAQVRLPAAVEGDHVCIALYPRYSDGSMGRRAEDCYSR